MQRVKVIFDNFEFLNFPLISVRQYELTVWAGEDAKCAGRASYFLNISRVSNSLLQFWQSIWAHAWKLKLWWVILSVLKLQNIPSIHPWLRDDCCRPPTFKQSTPSCRTNMRQLLWREQCLERERRTGQDTSTTSNSSSASSSACKIPTPLQDQTRIQDIPTEVYKVSFPLHFQSSAVQWPPDFAKQGRNIFQSMSVHLT